MLFKKKLDDIVIHVFIKIFFSEGAKVGGEGKAVDVIL